MAETPSSTARAATRPRALMLSKLSLVGTVTSSERKLAVMRAPGGDIHRLAPGDRIAGATVAAIGDGEVSLVKNGTARIYRMPKG